MRVSTITCHDVYNYGASLQTYALQCYVSSLGAEYEIIDYKPPYLSGHYSLTAVSNPVYNKPFIRSLYLLAKLPQRLRALKRKHKFDLFTQKYLHLSDKRYVSHDELMSYPPSDLFIAGSDQIWNTLFNNGQDKAFYLSFAPNSSRRISYAASFATDRIYNVAETFVINNLKNFDAVSVREQSALNLLSHLERNDGVLVCDPVFLLTEIQWDELADSADCEIPEKYILIYDTEPSERIKEIAKGLRELTGIKLLTISPTKGRYADLEKLYSGPLEFLKYLRNAEFVISNSFHATAFSIIFKKKFFTVNRSENINTRMVDFLNYLGLSKCNITSPGELSTNGIDYVAVSERLNHLIDASKSFLKKELAFAQQQEA